MADFHFLRPWWWLALIPAILAIWYFSKRSPRMQAWEAICDPHLLQYLLGSQQKSTQKLFSGLIFFPALFFIILALSGPTWSLLPTPIFKASQVRVLALDLSSSMLYTDIKPDRLSRAKFLIQDLLKKNQAGLFGMIAYTAEPFVVSPLTEDSNTIAALLPTLVPDIMPVQGQNPALALEEAQTLIHQAGFQKGEILVFTTTAPDETAINKAATLAAQGIYSSIVPLKTGKTDPAFTQFAKAGKGMVLPYSASPKDLEYWLNATQDKHAFNLSKNEDIPLWKDEGRWFLIPALIFLLPFFRRGWSHRMAL